MRQAQSELCFKTPGQGLVEVTLAVSDWVTCQAIKTGMVTIFCRHTSASLTIQENADPDVLHDMEAFFKRLVAEDPGLYLHTLEGPDDMPAHIRSALTSAMLNIPVADGHMTLGTWQGIYIFEHRRSPHERKLVLHLTGD